MKKITALLLTLVLSFSLVGCASSTANSEEITVTVEVQSERDNYDSSNDYTTDEATLADLLKAEELVDYEDSEYGMFIHGVAGMQDDSAEEYWWSLSVDGEMAMTGADGIELADNTTYTLTLVQGY